MSFELKIMEAKRLLFYYFYESRGGNYLELSLK